MNFVPEILPAPISSSAEMSFKKITSGGISPTCAAVRSNRGINFRTDAAENAGFKAARVLRCCSPETGISGSK